MYLLVFLSLLIGLAISSIFVKRFVFNTTGWYAIVMQFIFFIPCLLVDFVEYIKQQLDITPNTTYVLLGLEALIIALMVFLPKIKNSGIVSSDKVVLLNTPAFLDTVTQIADDTLFTLEDSKNGESTFLANYHYRREYSISFWAYLNQYSSDVTIPILKVGKGSESGGSPMITYSNGSCYFYLTNQSKKSQFSTKILPQKWNYFVVSYKDYNVDIFLNGDLVNTYVFNHANIDGTTKTDSLPTFGPGQFVEVGKTDIKPGMIDGYHYRSSDNNVSGAICNVVYHKTPMKQFDIISEYNTLMFSNPPIHH